MLATDMTRQYVKALSMHKTLYFAFQMLRGNRDLDVEPFKEKKLLESTVLDATRSVLAPVGTWATEELVIRSVK